MPTMPPPELMEELLEEILVRFPPDEPASLVRAALVCKTWCRLVSGTAFHRRFRKFHINRGMAPPLLGVLYTSTTGGGGGGDYGHKQQEEVRDDDDNTNGRCMKRARILREPAACFVPTCRTPTHNRLRLRLRYGWRAIDARHGRVLLRRTDPSLTYGRGLSVWDPVTDEQRDLPEPSFNELMLGCNWTAAVVCAATATAGGNDECCDHLDCPFLVIMMDVQTHVIYHSIYSSQSGAWSQLDVVNRPDPTFCPREFRQTPAVLVGTSLLCFLIHFNNEILQYDLATQDLSVPSEFHGLLEQGGLVLVTGDDGGIGFVAHAANNDTDRLELWSMVNNGDFVQTRAIHLHKVLPAASSSGSLRVNGFGFADGGATASSRFLFMRTSDGLYSIDLNSSHVNKIASCCGDDQKDNVLVPYISFCTPNSLKNPTPDTREPDRPVTSGTRASPL